MHDEGGSDKKCAGTGMNAYLGRNADHYDDYDLRRRTILRNPKDHYNLCSELPVRITGSTAEMKAETIKNVLEQGGTQIIMMIMICTEEQS